MKANEAPEKIYTDENGNNPMLKRHCDSDIEYTRTDAFIEKACEWLKENAYFYVNDYTGSLNEDRLVENFKNYMKGE